MCRDCLKCTNPMVANGARNFARVFIAVGTCFLSELVMACRPKCRGCGHQLSLHRGAAFHRVQPAAQVQAWQQPHGHPYPHQQPYPPQYQPQPPYQQQPWR